jgi:hypothetical protein
MSTGVMAKTDAMQRGRLAMDNVTQQLRSQVCLSDTTSAVVRDSTGTSVTFYADFTEAGTTPIKRTLMFDPARQEIRANTYETSSTAVPPPPDSYASAPSGSSLVLENARQQIDPVTNQPVPFLRYYAYMQVDGRPQAVQELTPPLDEAEAARVARIDIAYQALPTGSSDRSQGVNLTDQIVARHADPNLEIPDRLCT